MVAEVVQILTRCRDRTGAALRQVGEYHRSVVSEIVSPRYWLKQAMLPEGGASLRLWAQATPPSRSVLAAEANSPLCSGGKTLSRLTSLLELQITYHFVYKVAVVHMAP